LDNDFSWLNDLKSWSEKEVNAAFAYSLWAVENDTESLKDEVLAAKIMYYIHLDRLDEAKALLADVLAQKASLQSYCFTCCQEFLAAK
jgi:hypothetical protein